MTGGGWKKFQRPEQLKHEGKANGSDIRLKERGVNSSFCTFTCLETGPWKDRDGKLDKGQNPVDA